MSKDKKQLGILGEEIAKKYLLEFGFDIIKQNHSQKWGEIDIIAKKNSCFHFVEVKTMRINENFPIGITPEDQITGKKKVALERTALSYANHYKIGDWQIDLITIEIDSQNRKSIRYWENI